VPVGIAALVIGRRVLPATPGQGRARLDVVGLLLLCPGLSLAVLALSLAGERGSLLAPDVVLPSLLATRLVDRTEPRRVVGIGVLLALAGIVGRVVVLDERTPYLLLAALGAAGLGVGATLMPVMTAATRSLSGDDLRSGTTLLNALSGLLTLLSLGAALRLPPSGRGPSSTGAAEQVPAAAPRSAAR
jgi:MFS family permease